MEGWKKVCDAVHSLNGRIILQIWHGGRAGRSNIIGEKPIGPSPIPIRTIDKDGNIEYSEEPEELSEEGILQVVEEFRKGAENAKIAGFDALEAHGANGYLIDEFLRDSSNKRTDKYGGSVENRCRFPLMVIDALTSVFGPDRVGIKLSPLSKYQDMFDSDPLATYSHLLKELSRRNISFVEIVRNLYGNPEQDQVKDLWKSLKPYFSGVLIGNGNLTFEEASRCIDEGIIDMATFGRLFISNPDLVERFKNQWELSKSLPQFYYTNGKEGYIDYPKYVKNPNI